MHFTDEELIAYLLGDATTSTARQIESHAAQEPELVERLKFFRSLLGLLDSANENTGDANTEPNQGDANEPRFEPPAGLVESTMARVFDDLPVDNSLDHAAGSETEETVASKQSLDWQSKKSDQFVQPAVRLSPGLDAARNQRSIWDSTALTVCLTVLCCLALPALVRARFEARKSQCAEKLRTTGRGFFDYALNDPQQRLPSIAMHGPGAFAGSNVIHLHEAGLLESIGQLLCPSLSSHFNAAAVDDWQQEKIAESLFAKIPSELDLFELSESELAIVQAMLGGDYALPLGVLDEDGRPVSPRHEGRSGFPLASDAPVFQGTEELFIAHDGNGINILYDDGHVRFFTVVQLRRAQAGELALDCLADDPFCNARGERRIGLHRHDGSVAPSNYSPLGASK